MPDNQGLGWQGGLVNIRFENLLDKAKLLARIRFKKPELNFVRRVFLHATQRLGFKTVVQLCGFRRFASKPYLTRIAKLSREYANGSRQTTAHNNWTGCR